MNDNTFLEVGESYLFRTITMIYTGKIKKINDKEILITEAAWIPETERWHESVRDATFREVEPYAKDVILFKDSFLDVTKIDKLPREAK